MKSRVQTSSSALYPDLGVSSHAFVVDGAQVGTSALVQSDAGEGIFQTDHEIIGAILLVDSDTGRVFEPQLRRQSSSALVPWKHVIDKHLLPVVRIFAHCKASNGSLKIWVGSGFRVSPIHILTARHVVKSQHVDDDGKTYVLDKITFSTRVTARVVTEQHRGASLLGPSEYSLLDQVPVSSHFPDKLFITDTETWNTMNDFVFLTIASPESVQIPSAIPLFPRTSSDERHTSVVVSYPGDITFKKFAEDYAQGEAPSDSDPTSHAEALYASVAFQMANFETKVVSFGPWTPDPRGHLVFHQCPTIRGTSGGLFVQLDQLPPPLEDNSHLSSSGASASSHDASFVTTPLFEETGDSPYTLQHSSIAPLPAPSVPFFTGIHVGGNQRMRNNVVFPTSFPAFALEYVQHILLSTDQSVVTFIESNRDHLASFVSPHLDVLRSYLLPFQLTTLNDRLFGGFKADIGSG